MKVEFAYVPGAQRRAIAVVVSVKSQVVMDPNRREDVRGQLQKIADFRGLPVVLAARDGRRIRYHGDHRLVRQLAHIDALALPWRTATITSM